MADDELDLAIRSLYTGPLEGFTASRDALAKQLRAAGDRDGAAAVKRLRRPTVPAWAVDQLSVSAPGQLAELLSVSAALAEAQLGGDHDRLRSLSAQHRSLLQDLVALAAGALTSTGRDPSAALEAIRSTLLAAGSDGDVAADVVAGRLAAPAAASGLGPLPEGWAPAAAGARAAAARATDPPSRAGSRRADKEREAARRAARKEAEAALRAATKRRQDAERELEAAREAEAAAEGALAELDPA